MGHAIIQAGLKEIVSTITRLKGYIPFEPFESTISGIMGAVVILDVVGDLYTIKTEGEYVILSLSTGDILRNRPINPFSNQDIVRILAWHNEMYRGIEDPVVNWGYQDKEPYRVTSCDEPSVFSFEWTLWKYSTLSDEERKLQLYDYVEAQREKLVREIEDGRPVDISEVQLHLGYSGIPYVTFFEVVKVKENCHYWSMAEKVAKALKTEHDKFAFK